MIYTFQLWPSSRISDQWESREMTSSGSVYGDEEKQEFEAQTKESV